MAKLSWVKEISRYDPLNLPGWLWIIIGLFVFIVSLRLGSKFILFVWLGLIFLVFGVFKVISWSITKKEVSAPEQRSVKQAMGAPTTSCHNCRRSVYNSQYYCHHCGKQLR